MQPRDVSKICLRRIAPRRKAPQYRPPALSLDQPRLARQSSGSMWNCFWPSSSRTAGGGDTVSGLFRTCQRSRVRPALWNPHRRYALSVAGYPASPRGWTTISRPPVPWISCAARMKRAPASPRRRCARRDAERLDCRGVRGRVEPGDTTRPKNTIRRLDQDT